MSHKYNLDWLINRYENGENLKYIFFWGNSSNHNQEVGKFCFSQWYEIPFTVENTVYKTAEHWMMSEKAKLFDDEKTYYKIIASNKPGEAKELGRQITGFNEEMWNQKKFEIVVAGNIHKFNQNKSLGEYLIQTGNRILVESSPIDIIWGNGLSQDDKNIENLYCWRGTNLLGFALMEVRDFLNENGFVNLSHFNLETPWKKYPKIDSEDLFWRMGKGEDFLISFYKSFEKLNDKEKSIFKLYNPAPKDWKSIYE